MRPPDRRLRRALSLAGALAAAAFLALGCGDEEPGAPAPGTPRAHLTVAEVESVLERGAPALVRTGAGAQPTDRDGLADSVRFEEQSGRAFELFVWTTPRVALRRRAALLAAARAEHGEDAAVIRAANVVAVFPGSPNRIDAYRAAASAMSRLGAACIRGAAAQERLRRLCFGEDAVPPPGEGVDRDEAAEEGDAVVVGGLRYQALVARRLNPDIAPDTELVSDRRPPQGTSWFGVFLLVCNAHGSATRVPARQLALVTASGERLAPRELSDDNPFGYEPRPVEPQRCLPGEGTVAGQVNDAGLVLFAVSKAFLADRPVALEIRAGDAPARRVVLDI